MEFTKVKIVTYVPIANADGVRKALGYAGAGAIGKYSHNSYSVVGKARFTPSKLAKPYISKANVAETVDEERIEVMCDRKLAKKVIEAMKKAHPYEEAVFDIYPLLNVTHL